MCLNYSNTKSDRSWTHKSMRRCTAVRLVASCRSISISLCPPCQNMQTEVSQKGNSAQINIYTFILILLNSEFLGVYIHVKYFLLHVMQIFTDSTQRQHRQIWLVVFGLNDPLRHYFSLYRVVSQREGEKEEKG